MQAIRHAGLLGLAALIACGESGAVPIPDAGPTPADVREAVTPSGVVVRVRTDPEPPATGPIRVFITVAGPVDRTPRSVDLVSPTMPMHGVTRFAIEAAGTDWIADLEIPMEGEWSLYVNFDDGTDAAEIRFAVGEAQAQSHTHQPIREDSP